MRQYLKRIAAVLAIVVMIALWYVVWVYASQHRLVAARFARRASGVAQEVKALTEAQIRAFLNLEANPPRMSPPASTLPGGLVIDRVALVAGGIVDTGPVGLRVRLEPHSCSSTLLLSATAFTRDSTKQAVNLVKIQGHIDLGELLASNVLGLRLPFDGVLVATPDGRVVAGWGATADVVVSVEESLGAWESLQPPRSDTANAGKGGRSLRSALLGWEPPERIVAGENYRVLVQSCVLDFRRIHEQFRSRPEGQISAIDPDSLTELTLRIVGLVKADRFEAECRRLRPVWLLLLGAVAVLALLALPILKLFHGPAEQFRRLDLAVLPWSVVGIAAVASLAVSCALSWWAVREREYTQLEELAKNLVDNFQQEIKQAERELNELADRANADWGAHEITENVVVNLLSNTRPDVIETYPHFWRYSRYDGEGRATLLATINASATSPASVADRRYFRAAKNAGEGEICAACVEPVFSWVTGERGTVIAMRTAKHPQPPSPDGTVVHALFGPLLSLEQVALPEGFDFAVLDRQGQVLYHSDAARALSENFLTECAPQHEVQAFLGGKAAARLQVNYDGRAHRMYVRPFESRPWTLVVFRPTHYSDSALTNAVAVASAGVVASAAPVLVVILICCWLAGGKSVYGGEESADQVQKVANRRWFSRELLPAILAFVLLVVFLGVTSWPIVLAAASLPLVSAFAFRAFLLVSSRNTRLTYFDRCGMSTARIVVGLVLLLAGVLPAVLFFAASLHVEEELLVRGAQRTLADRLSQRWESLRRRYEGVNGAERVLRRRWPVPDKLASHWDTPTSFFFETKIGPDNAGGGTENRAAGAPTLLRFYDALRPQRDEFGVHTRALLFEPWQGRYGEGGIRSTFEFGAPQGSQTGAGGASSRQQAVITSTFASPCGTLVTNVGWGLVLALLAVAVVAWSFHALLRRTLEILFPHLAAKSERPPDPTMEENKLLESLACGQQPDVTKITWGEAWSHGWLEGAPPRLTTRGSLEVTNRTALFSRAPTGQSRITASTGFVVATLALGVSLLLLVTQPGLWEGMFGALTSVAALLAAGNNLRAAIRGAGGGEGGK